MTPAGTLTLPLVLPDGSPFSARNLAIVLVIGIILLSLILASIGLPMLLRGLQLASGPMQQKHPAEEQAARAAADGAAIEAIKQAERDLAQTDPGLLAEAATRALNPYERRQRAGQLDEGAARTRKLAACRY